MRLTILFLIAAIAALMTGPARANDTIYCKSKHNNYTECAAPFTAPVLVMQKSAQPCIINSTWGFNPITRNIWVAAGCNGIFADSHGYLYGQGGGFDRNARRYSRGGTFVGYGPYVVINKSRQNRVTNYNYDGPGGIGTYHNDRQPAQKIDRTPQFDRNGNPNFDIHGNYIGPHGLGELVDAPAEPVENDAGNPVDGEDE